MKTKRIISPALIIVTILVTVLYLFLAPRPLGKEYQFSPVWKISILSQPVTEKTDNVKMHFRLGQSVGYFTGDGQITLHEQFQDKVSISNTFYAHYSSDAINTPFYTVNGDKAGEIQAAGYPYFSGELIFVFLPGGASFAKCDSTGAISWRYEGTLPITAFTAKKNFIAAGFADGTIKLFDTMSGNCLLSFAPGGSDYPVILGLDISDDGQYIASVSGHEKQRFVLAHREENQPKIIYHTFLKEGMPYRTLVHFTEDSNQVVYNYQGNIGVYNLSTQKENIIPVKQKIISIEETDNFIFLLGHEKDDFTVYLVEKTNQYEGSFSFKANTAFIQTNGEELFVGKDNTISKIAISRE